jgi:hypothetical protein
MSASPTTIISLSSSSVSVLESLGSLSTSVSVRFHDPISAQFSILHTNQASISNVILAVYAFHGVIFGNDNSTFPLVFVLATVAFTNVKPAGA